VNTRGHNERSFRLDALAAEAREGLAKVEQGEEYTIGGWLAYGHALNEGRALFPGDREFGEWVDANALRQVAGADGTLRDVEDHERKAAMWAAANAEQFEEARQRGNPRTIRGIYAKWKEIEAERAEEQRRLEAEAAEKVKREEVTAPETNENGSEGDETAQTVTAQSKPDQETPPTYAEGAATPEASCEGASGGGEPDTAPAPQPDPYGYAKLTEEALLETANGLRADLDEEKDRRKTAEAERDDVKARLDEALAGDDMGRALGKAQKQRDTAKHRLGEEQAKNARQQRRIDKLTAEVKQLRAKLESQEVTL